MRPIDRYLLIHRRQQRMAARQRSLNRRLARTTASLGAVLFLFFTAAVILAAFAYGNLVDGLPSIQALPAYLDSQQGAFLQPTRIYDRTGEHLLYTVENPGVPRRYLPLQAESASEALSPELSKALVALQDPTFWKNPGFLWEELTTPKAITLAEKLVEDLLLWQEPAGLRKALRMRILANQVIHTFGREQTLEWYLNTASFGHLAYGAESAARLYLGKSAAELNLAEASLLISTLDAPALNPLDAPSAALERQQAALLHLLASGTIDSETYQTARDTQLNFQTGFGEPYSPALAFSNRVIEELGHTISRSQLERGGLRILTTLDYDLQIQLTCTAQTQLARLTGNDPAPNAANGQPCEAARLLPTLPLESLSSPRTAASAAILDPATGKVLALIGDTTLQGESKNLSSHPGGSLLSPFVAVTGFARSLGPASLLWDIPKEEAAYTNPDGEFHGPVRLRTALANDYIVPLNNLLEQLDPASVIRTAQALGLTKLELTEQPEDFLFIGADLDPLEAAHAYSTFATLGILNGEQPVPSSPIRPILIESVQDISGQEIWKTNQGQTQAVLSQQLAYLVHDILSDEPARWPSLGYPNSLEIGRPAGAKISQTADRTSTWTVGYTRQILTLVWIGSLTPSNAIQPQVSAGIWHAMMQYTSRDLPILDWEQPGGITRMEVCDPSGLLPTPQCPNIVPEIFLTGNEPTSLDNLYQSFEINRETKRLATIFTPPELVEKRTYLVVPPEAQAWSRLKELPVPPLDYDVIQIPPASAGVNFTAPQQFEVVHGKINLLGSAAGDDFASYSLQIGKGINPQAWLTLGEPITRAVNNGLLGVWDTAVEDGLYVIRLVVLRQNQRVETAILQVTVDNTNPLARISYPFPSQKITPPASRQIILEADVQDQVGIQRVEWWLDGKLIGERRLSPYQLPWQATRGEHKLQVRAYDLAGNEGVSETISFTIP